MAIALNASQCCCTDFPAWTVYHSNVSEKLHYYLSFFTANGSGIASPIALFYEGLSGDYLIYGNCSYFAPPTGNGPGSEINNSASYKMYLQHTDVAPTGGSTRNTWIKAARIERVEISGQFYGGFAATNNVNTVLTYSASNPQYTMGNHYCHCSGFSGALVKTSGSPVSAFTVCPGIAGKEVSSSPSSSPLSRWITNSDTFNQYNINETSDTLPRSNFGLSTSSTFAHGTGIIHQSSGINSASRSFVFSGACSCILPFRPYTANEYLYTFDVSNYNSGTYVSLQTYKRCLEILPTTFLMNCAYPRNSSLSAYNSYFPSVSFVPETSGSYFDCDYAFLGSTKNTFAESFSSNGYNATIGNGLNGFYGCSDPLSDFSPNSGIFYCVSGNNPSGYSIYSYSCTASGASCSGFLVPYRPVLAIMRIVNFYHTQNIITQALFDDNLCGDTLDPTGIVYGQAYYRGRAVKYTFNYDVGIALLNNFPSKHVLEDFNLDSDFDTQTISPWFGSIVSGASYMGNNICPPTGTGIYTSNYGVSGSGTTFQYTYHCSTLSGVYYSVPNNCEVYYNITSNPISFTNLQLIIPSSELCV